MPPHRDHTYRCNVLQHLPCKAAWIIANDAARANGFALQGANDFEAKRAELARRSVCRGVAKLWKSAANEKRTRVKALELLVANAGHILEHVVAK